MTARVSGFNRVPGPTAFLSGSGELQDRIKRLRLIRHWDQATLAERAGTSATVISQVERGRISPTADQLSGIADALGCTSDFLKSELGLFPTTRPWLRAYADASRREASARTALATTAVEYVRRLDLKPLPDLIPRFNLHPEDDEAIDDAADELRQLANIDHDSVVVNAIRAAERLGCIVIPLESELGKHLGMSVRSDQIPLICVAKDGIPGDRQRFTVAHELGHLALHGSVPPPQTAEEASRMERQANRFAAAFLGPADSLIHTLEEFGGKVTLRTLAEVKAVWGIAIKALVHRFQSLGVIDADHARSLYKQISARKWSKSEPVDVPTEVAQWFERSLLRKSDLPDLTSAATELAARVGGSSADLLALADWGPAPEAEILYLAQHRMA